MNIKEKIGQRIQAERTSKGLTRKALAELTDDLKQSRINNWERGDRTPGPQEIKQLAKALDVSPAFLMCLTDDKQSDKPKKFPWLGALIPLLNSQQACNPKHSMEAMNEDNEADKAAIIPLNTELLMQVGEYAFALRMEDSSMGPELRENDILIVDPDQQPTPGGLVVACMEGSNEIIIRRYKQLTASKKNQEFELVALNENWANISVDHNCSHKIVGVILGIIRKLKSN